MQRNDYKSLKNGLEFEFNTNFITHICYNLYG